MSGTARWPRAVANVVRARALSGKPSRRELKWRWKDGGRGFYRYWFEVMRAEPPRRSHGFADAVILCHRRPYNTELLVRAALLSRNINQVIVSNNNPDVDVERLVGVSSPRVVVRDDPGVNANRRYLIADQLGSALVYAPDDDLFLRPDRVDAAIDRLRRDGRSPLAPQGQRIRDGRTIGGIYGHEQQVDILNRAYFCTDIQVEKALELASKMGLPPGSENFRTFPIDDVLISFSGETWPVVIELPLVNCATSTYRSVATYQRPGFHERRVAWVEELRGLRGWDEAPLPPRPATSESG